MWYIRVVYMYNTRNATAKPQQAPRSLLAEGLEADALDGLERLLAGGRDGLAEHELRDERPRLREVPRREHLRRDERVVVLQRRAEALRLERSPHNVLQDALEVRIWCVLASTSGQQERQTWGKGKGREKRG